MLDHPIVIMLLSGLAGIGIFMLIGTSCWPSATLQMPGYCVKLTANYFDYVMASALLGMMLGPATWSVAAAVRG